MANMELITSVTVGSGGAASVTLPATGTIPATYTDLQVFVSSRGNSSGVAEANRIHFNGDTTNTNYTAKRLLGSGSAASSDQTATIVPGFFNNRTSSTASTFSNSIVYIPNYRSSNSKSYSIDTVTENNATEAYMALLAVNWSGTAAITTMTFTPESSALFVEGSTFYLYGISNVTSGSKATGGIVSSDGTYWYHMFPYSGTFTPTTNLTADYLVIAGGGGGNFGQGTNAKAGGGGAGGLRSTVTATGGGGSLESALSLTANTAYTVTVGAGGAGGVHTVNNAGNGSNSVFSTITSTGGGKGAGYQENNSTGGSGGGGAGGIATQNGAAGTTNQGYAGGNALGYSNDTNGGGGGGGGAGAAGGNASSTATAGAGGAGVAIPTFANATQTGVNTYYAGGGGGAAVTQNGAGGLGGGGAGGYGNSGSTMNGIAGIINTGSGGGGGSAGSSSATGGAGGSGLVIIRYAI